MEAQQNQQSTSSIKARRQQPTDSLAASLPQETLLQILEASLEGLDAWGRQQARMSFDQVCAGWYGVVDLSSELAVSNTKMAERLVSSLAKTNLKHRRGVRSLSIRIEEKGAGRGQRADSILKICTRLETLELLGMGRYLGNSSFPLGTALGQALRSLNKIKDFKIVHSDSLRLQGGDLMGSVRSPTRSSAPAFRN
jgi:hypothetical protein